MSARDRPVRLFAGHLALGVFVLSVVVGCQTVPEVRRDADLVRLASYLTGTFDSSAQAAADDSYLVVDLRAVEIWPEAEDGIWLYVEQQVRGARSPYRQRVVRLVRDAGGTLRQMVYTIRDPSIYAGGWRVPGRFAVLGRDELAYVAGCDNLFRLEGARFIGGTRARDCRNDYKGAAYMTSIAEVGADGFTNWDRGFDVAGERVWGPPEGGYRFRRTGGEPAM
jgi:hypothetical protein